MSCFHQLTLKCGPNVNNVMQPSTGMKTHRRSFHQDCQFKCFLHVNKIGEFDLREKVPEILLPSFFLAFKTRRTHKIDRLLIHQINVDHQFSEKLIDR